MRRELERPGHGRTAPSCDETSTAPRARVDTARLSRQDSARLERAIPGVSSRRARGS